MMAMAADQKNALWQSVQQKLKEKLNDLPSVSEKEVRDVFKIIAQNSDTNDEWGTFKVHFESVHPQFFTILSQINANLTHLELRQCAYIKINLSPKQVSNLLNITPDSVKKARLRIKKKLNLSTEDSLTKFIATIQG
jgi:DNA-binding CsgD family transcriptional regulator